MLDFGPYVIDSKGEKQYLFPAYDFPEYKIPEDAEPVEEDSATIETAPLFWELIRDELEASKDWEHITGLTLGTMRRVLFLGLTRPEPRNYYQRGAHRLDMSTEGQIKHMGAMSAYIDETTDLTEGDNLAELLTWIQEGGPCPLYRKEESDGTTRVGHPDNALLS